VHSYSYVVEIVVMLLHEFLFVHDPSPSFLPFFFTDTAPSEIYTLSLHDALPISVDLEFVDRQLRQTAEAGIAGTEIVQRQAHPRSEEHTSELQSLAYLVCRLLLEKKKMTRPNCYDVIH